MKVYFACPFSTMYLHNLEACGVQRTLVSFAAKEAVVSHVMQTFPDVMVDSGAYSIANAGGQIELDDYIEFCLAREPEACAALDVIGDPEATHANWQRMVDAGVDAVPVVHRNTGPKWLHYYAERVPYLALGGVAGASGYDEGFWSWMDSAFGVLMQHWPIKVHAFGMQHRPVLERYPVYSCDSTSWYSGLVWGMHMATDGKMTRVGKQKTAAEREKIARTRPEVAMAMMEGQWNEKGSATDKLVQNNIRSTLKLEEHATRLWASRGIEWEQA